MSDKPTVVEAWSAVMAAVGGVGKAGFNKAQKYNFRGIDAVVNAVGPALREHGVIILPTVLNANFRDIKVGQNQTSMREVTVEVRYSIFGPAGDVLAIEGVPNLGTVFGESMDSGDKGTAKAMSVAYRIFLLQALCIPTDESDPDESSYERAPEPADPRISQANADALRERCAGRGLDVAKVVKLGTDGRTDDPVEVHRDEVKAVKDAMDKLDAQDPAQVIESATREAESGSGQDGGTPTWDEEHPDAPF